MTTSVLRDRCGRVIPLHVDRWRAEADAVEQALLASLPDPVLDIGCGPGRVTAALAAAGRRALGIDPSPAAIEEAAGRGAAVLRRSVFDLLPGERRWGSAVLLDGNVGIGGDPGALMRRVAHLLRRGGHVVVEVAPPGSPTERIEVRLEREGRSGDGPWFPWARVGVEGVDALMESADLLLVDVATGGGRWFARAVKP